MAQIVVRQSRSLISEPEKIRKIVKALGLGRIGSEATHKDNNCIRGMINKVKHLVSYELKG
jgi:large subunit ribosomal protein L30